MSRSFLVVPCVLLVAEFLARAEGKSWTQDTSTTATTLMGVGIAHGARAAAAAAQNGVGAILDSYNGTAWHKEPVKAGLVMDSAISASGVAVSTSMYNVFISTDAGSTYSVAPGVGGISQNANVFGASGESIALVGSWKADTTLPTGVSGVATSTDKGATWTLSSEVPLGWVRYGAFPSDTTWYISSGMWGNDPAEKNMKSARIQVDETGAVNFKENVSAHKKLADGTTGWFGGVSKTTDGGKTWSQVFLSDLNNDYYYFNGISCPSESHCVVVGEGDDAVNGGYLNVAYTTFDGGVTWDRTITGSDVSMMMVDFISEDEGWVAATKKSGRNLIGQFYHTLDGGKTWAVDETLNNCFPIDMDFSTTDGVGIAACISSSGASCTAAWYR